MIHTRQELIDYAKRKLGFPVINLELDDAQVEDRVDEALQFFQDFHYDATERVYLKHQLRGTELPVAMSGTFIPGEAVTGSVSGLSFVLDSVPSATMLVTKKLGGVLDASDMLTGATSGATAVITGTIVIGDFENQYVPTSELVTGVTRVIPFNNFYAGSNFMFDPKYLFVVQNFHNIASTSIIDYSMYQSQISLIEQTLRPIDSIRFNRHANRIYMDIDWNTLSVGQYLIFDAFRVLDPEVFHDIYNDRMLKKLVVAKIKYQWAMNVQKFSSVALLGGITINAANLLDQAEREIESAEHEIRDSYEIPPMGFIG